jgi:hypothetical protein
LTELSEQNTNLQQNLVEKEQIINQLEQKLADEQEKRTITENNLSQERQRGYNLEQQLQNEKETNTNLNTKLIWQEQNHTNLQNAYQQAIKDKQEIIKLIQLEKERVDYYENQLKSIAKMLNQ